MPDLGQPFWWVHVCCVCAEFDILVILEDKNDATTVVVKGAWYATMKNDRGEPVQGCSVVMPWVHWWFVKAGKIHTYE